MTDVLQAPRPMTERRTLTDRRGRASRAEANALASAIDSGALEVLFQPQFLCEDDSLAGAEALVRWEHPEQGPLAGDRIFALARDADLSESLTRHVLTSAMRAAVEWPDVLRLSVNATAQDLGDPAYPALVRECLRETGFPASRLTLEITEQALVDCLDTAAALLRPLADAGIALALDDFGAGFCNFRYLKVLPLAALKLDRSMVEGITTDRQDLAVLRGIMAMARALDLRVIAEGVETVAQRLAVCREGCDRWQGFLGARPMEVQGFRDLCMERADVTRDRVRSSPTSRFRR